MNIRRFIIFGMLLILISCVVAVIYPFAAPLIAHHQTKGIVTTLLNELLTPHKKSLVEQYYPYILLGIMAVIYPLLSYDMKHRSRTTHGSAHHARGRERNKYYAPRMLFLKKPHRPGSRAVQPFLTWKQSARSAFRVRVGKHRGRVVSLDAQQQYQHVLVVGPTGVGKGTRFFVPNLLRETGTRSLFIADLKKELYALCAGWLSQSMQVWLFSPTQPTISGSYNPLAHIRSVEDAQDFAETWVMNTSKNQKDTFWDTNSQLLITAMTLHLLATEKAPAFSRLADLLTTSSFDEIRAMLTSTPSRDARYIALQFLENMDKNERLVGSQMVDTGNRFQLMASHHARAVTAANTLDFEEMIDTPTAFFLSIPRNATRRYRPLLACLTQQMFAAWEERGTNGIACYLDEFANLGYIPGFAEFISTARALKISLMMAIQNFAQLAERYGRNDADTIKNNAVTHVLFPGAGLEECRYYSERIGDTTVKTETINRRGYGWSEEVTSSEGETHRRLMTPDELRTMPSDNVLMIEATAPSLIVTTQTYFENKDLAGRANTPHQGAQTFVHPVPPMPSPTTPRSATGLPAPATTAAAQKPQQPAGPPLVVDADEDDEDESQFFQQ